MVKNQKINKNNLQASFNFFDESYDNKKEPVKAFESFSTFLNQNKDDNHRFKFDDEKTVIDGKRRASGDIE